MAIIKCPECGRQISDKAPTCPNCGVEIAGKVIKCAQCGEVYFNNQESCPNCHHHTPLSFQISNDNTAEPARNKKENNRQADTPTVQIPVPPTNHPTSTNPAQHQKKRKKSVAGPVIISLIIAVALCGVCFYFYNSSKKEKEMNDYAFAMKSDDPLVLQTYLNNNLDAPEEHRDSVMARMEFLKRQDRDWSNALVSGSKFALQDYLAKHPDSEHAQEARHKIDSIDWADASNENTLEAVQLYLAQHANGEYVDEANAALKKIKTKTVTQEDRAIVTRSLRRFFQSVNAQDESGLEDAVTPLLTNFLGKTDATKADVLTFMRKIYKDDIINMNWRLNNDYKIDKKEIGDERYEYTVSVSALQSIERTDKDKEKEARYRIKATIDPDGYISAMTMTKILE